MEEQQLQQAVDRAEAEVNRLQQQLQQAEGRNPRDQGEVTGILQQLRDAERAQLDAIRAQRIVYERWNKNLQTAVTMINRRDGRPEQWDRKSSNQKRSVLPSEKFVICFQ